MEQLKNTTLIIGGPNAGKTHFGGQLYGRLQTKAGLYKITSPPENLMVFKEVLENLNEGKSAGHTNVSAHELLEIQVEDTNGVKSVFSFPDYGGEQVKSIVNDRRINRIWKNQIEKSNSWMLFIRLDEIPPLEDVVNRGLPQQEVLVKRNNSGEPMLLSSSAFYVELLQMLLYVKKVAPDQFKSFPNLTIVLSCWDLIEERATGKFPSVVLKDKLPALYSFLETTWKSDVFRVIGLSSTGKTLSDKEPDMDFVKKGPEKFGFIITENGEKQQDLTLSIGQFIGTGK